MDYQLKTITFYLSTRIDGYWWEQEVKDASQIVSDAIPDWMGLVIHRGLTPKKTPGKFWSISDRLTGGILFARALLPVFDQHALIQIAIKNVRNLDRKDYEQSINHFWKRQKGLKYVGRKRLSSADRNSRNFLQN